MKITSIIQGQAVRLLHASNPISGFYMPEVVKSLQERYGFVQVPSTLTEYDATKGVTFQHGKFTVEQSEGKSHAIVIDAFQVYTDGILVRTRVHTDDADKFLDDVMQWAVKAFGLKLLDEPPQQRHYLTQFEVDCSDLHLPNLKIGRLIDQCLKRYGQTTGPYDTTSITLYCDTLQALKPIPYPFIFSRREGLPYSSNLYFSSAPLSTKDHEALLQEAEKVLLFRD